MIPEMYTMHILHKFATSSTFMFILIMLAGISDKKVIKVSFLKSKAQTK